MANFKRSSNKSQETRKIKKILNEEIRLGINARSDSEPEEVDLKKELFPLGHYINDREEMIEQMFSIIKGEKLKKMLPPILKDIPLDEIKADCLIHLLGMSTKRIMATLEGREIYSSSDSETGSASSTSPNKKAKLELKPFMIKQEGCSDISDNSEEVVLIEPDAESSRSTKGSQKHKKRHKHKRKNLPENIKKTKKKIHKEKVKKPIVVENNLLDSSTDSENEVKGDSPKEEKSLLEMLELEMRRRAIQALLEKEGHPDRGGKNLEKPTLTTENLSDKTKKPNSTDNKSEKITPVKNFRKKKHANDDVIVIVPELVTIDLTNENKKSEVDSNKVVDEHNKEEVENLINSIQINADEEKDQLNQNNDAEDSSEECSNTSETKSDVDPDGRKIGIDEVIDILDSPEENETQNNTEKAQPNQDMMKVGENQQQHKSNWATRWLDSKDVKKVVSTSKICGNIRKKIKNAKLAKKSQENLTKYIVDTPEIHGSVVEYQSLPKSSMALNTSTDTATGNDTEAIKSNENISAQVDEIKGNQTVSDLKETNLVVEQVQDVSSTKSEISGLTNTDDQIIRDVDVNETLKTIISDVDVNETLDTSNSNDHKEKGDDSQKVKNFESREPTQVEISNIIDTSSKSYLEVDTPSMLFNDSIVLNVSPKVNICDVNPNNVSTSINLGSGGVNNLESEQVKPDQTECENTATNLESENSNKISLFQHNDSLDDKSDNLEIMCNTGKATNYIFDLNKTLKANINVNEDSSSCKSRKSSISESSNEPIEQVPLTKLMNTVQENGNELEALEIDITEEDREIE